MAFRSTGFSRPPLQTQGESKLLRNEEGMMATLNRVFIIGNLTKAPALRYTPGGAAVADLRMAINSTYVNKSGERTDEVCYVDVVVWGRQAETAAEYLTKGSPAFIEGRLQLDTWETGTGEKRSRLRVRANRIQFLGRPREAKPTQEAAFHEGPVAEMTQEDEAGPGAGAPSGAADDVPF
jgi:single-strand DNA-binding protein